MWAKDYYQEQMLGYLDWVQTEIEHLEQTRIRQNDLNELYDDLEIALERLWQLIWASDVDWEGFRYTLEASCDTLLLTFYRVPRADSLILPVRLTIIENHETRSQLWKQAEMVE
jgi:hypothetical protein